jgi:hypothetical protein
MMDMQRGELDRAGARERHEQVEEDGGIEAAREPGADAGTRRQPRRDLARDMGAQVYSATSLNLP